MSHEGWSRKRWSEFSRITAEGALLRICEREDRNGVDLCYWSPAGLGLGKPRATTPDVMIHLDHATWESFSGLRYTVESEEPQEDDPEEETIERVAPAPTSTPAPSSPKAGGPPCS